MPKLFYVLIALIAGIVVLVIGILLVGKTENTLQKMIELMGIRKKTFQYEFMTNRKNLIHYKIIGILFILFGILSIVVPILKTIAL